MSVINCKSMEIKNQKHKENTLKRNLKGFTLIEILIVLSIIAVLVVTFATPKRSPQKLYKDYFRQLSLMSKKIKNRAQIERSTYRMIFYMSEGTTTEITVEKTEEAFLLGTEKESKELFEDLYKDKKEFSKRKQELKKEKNKTDTESSSLFKVSERFKPDNLKKPQDLNIIQIEISGIDEIFEPEGLAMFHYFSNGLVEEAAIQVQNKDETLKWTLITDPITGQIYARPGHKTLKEIKEL